MTTSRSAQASRNRSAAASKATARRMERNTCPECGRKGAVTRNNLPDDVACACRYCKYAVLKGERDV